MALSKTSVKPTVKTVEPRVIPRKIPLDEIDPLIGFTPRVQRLKKKWMDTTSMVSSDRGYYYMESWKVIEGEHESVRVAKMFRNYCEKCRMRSSAEANMILRNHASRLCKFSPS